MSNMSKGLAFLTLVVLLALNLGACSKKTVPTQPNFGAGGAGAGGYGGGAGDALGGAGSGGGYGGMEDAKWRELGINSEAEKQEFLKKAEAFENRDVYFDYDEYTLSEPAKKILDEKAAFLRRYPKAKVTVEGHCDSRGTNEYNLALGERRANAAMQYLAKSGLNAQNLNLISYGEERPLAGGTDEASYAKNRRAHFVINY